MIITRSPFRMSFFGGGTDYPPFFEEHGGSVLSTTFDKYCYTTVRHLPPFFDYRNQLTYSVIERVVLREEIRHPMVREAMKWLDMHELCITYDADLPARSGLGSSSSFAAALLLAFHALKGQYIAPQKLAEESIYLERVLCAEAGGWQDQIAACYGGFNRIDFSKNGFRVSPVILSRERREMLNKRLMLFFTGFSRISSNIAKEQTAVVRDRTAELQEMCRLVDEAEKILVSKCTSLDEFGHLLNYTWELKRSLTKSISSSTLDEIYQSARNAGALGGKLLGAGGGGFFLFYVPEGQQDSVRKVLGRLLYVPFRFEDQGAQVLYYRPEDYDPPYDGRRALAEEQGVL